MTPKREPGAPPDPREVERARVALRSALDADEGAWHELPRGLVQSLLLKLNAALPPVAGSASFSEALDALRVDGPYEPTLDEKIAAIESLHRDEVEEARGMLSETQRALNNALERVGAAERERDEARAERDRLAALGARPVPGDAPGDPTRGP